MSSSVRDFERRPGGTDSGRLLDVGSVFRFELRKALGRLGFLTLGPAIVVRLVRRCRDVVRVVAAFAGETLALAFVEGAVCDRRSVRFAKQAGLRAEIGRASCRERV